MPFCDRHGRANAAQRAAWIGAAKRRASRQDRPHKATLPAHQGPGLWIVRQKGFWFGPENAKLPKVGEFTVVVYVGGAALQRPPNYAGFLLHVPWPLQLRSVAPAIYAVGRALAQQGKVLICGQPEARHALVTQIAQALHVPPSVSNRQRSAR